MTSPSRCPLAALCAFLFLSGIAAAEERFSPLPRAAGDACAQATVYGTEGIPVDPETYPTVFVQHDEIRSPFPLGLTLKNTGRAPLTGLTIEITGDHAAEFVAGAVDSITLAPGRKMRLPVELHPVAPGVKKATVRIGSNDCTRPVLEFNLHFAVFTGPDISRVNLYDHELGDTILFGPTAGGDAHDDFFYIRNIGSREFRKLRLRVEGPHAGDFAVSRWKWKTLLRGQRERMDVSFRPTAPGERAATLVFTSDDFDEPEFRVELRGTATDAPRLKIIDREPGLDFGSLAPGQTARRSFLVANSGFSPLDLVTVDAPAHYGMFVVSPLTSFSLQPGEVRKITVALTQNGIQQNATISVRAHQDFYGGSFIPWFSELRAARK